MCLSTLAPRCGVIPTEVGRLVIVLIGAPYLCSYTVWSFNLLCTVSLQTVSGHCSLQQSFVTQCFYSYSPFLFWQPFTQICVIGYPMFYCLPLAFKNCECYFSSVSVAGILRVILIRSSVFCFLKFPRWSNFPPAILSILRYNNSCCLKSQLSLWSYRRIAVLILHIGSSVCSVYILEFS